MGVLGDVISVGPNGPSVGASSNRWLEDVITVGPNGPSGGIFYAIARGCNH